MRLPSKVVFPFGYTVTVKEATDVEMADELDCEPAETPDGMWDCESRTIFLRKSLPMRRKKYVLSHEFGHAFLDWQHHCFNWGAMEP